MFRDYRSTVDDFRTAIKKSKHGKELARSYGVDPDSYESIYRAEMKNARGLKDPFCKARIVAELLWYRDRRPYFNVYPVIEKKLLEINEDIHLNELYLPYTSIEVRTKTRTILASDMGEVFLFIVEMGGGKYQEFMMKKNGKVGAISSADYKEIETDWPKKTHGPGLTGSDRTQCAFIVCGTCLLAKDSSVVSPVVLNKDRREEMTPEELKKYAEKAAATTGKTGFEVGREIQLKQASIHYRNGCFAKYYVGKTHEAFPKNATCDKAPIIKWRCGAVVNAGNAPKVPTGFKGNQEESN